MAPSHSFALLLIFTVCARASTVQLPAPRAEKDDLLFVGVDDPFVHHAPAHAQAPLLGGHESVATPVDASAQPRRCRLEKRHAKAEVDEQLAFEPLHESVSFAQDEPTVETETHDDTLHRHRKRKLGKPWTGDSYFKYRRWSGVSAQQMVLVDQYSVLILDKAEHNPLLVPDGSHPAWGSVYDLRTGLVRALDLKSNTFCAGGGFLGNGTFVSTGGNPTENIKSAQDGIQSLRFYGPCSRNDCEIQEYEQVRMTSARWYPSVTTLTDGSILITGGITAGQFNGAPSVNNPTHEYWPPKAIQNGQAIYSPFLSAALNTNTFPFTALLPDGNVFMAANLLAIIYSPTTNTQRSLPGIPNGVRINYPSTAASCLLPLTRANGWTPEVFFCGGSTANVDGDPWLLSSQTPASTQCIRMVLNEAGIARGWDIEQAPHPMVMAQAVLSPEGKVILINGAQTGVAGYGNVRDQVGYSNADHPNYAPLLYDPVASKGRRFTSLPAAKVERMYHSSATLIPDGRVLVSGSNPNPDVTDQRYATQYRVELLTPPYMALERPTFSGAPSNLVWGRSYLLSVTIPANTRWIQATLVQPGFATHSLSMNQRYVELETDRLAGDTQVRIHAPAHTGIFPPSPALLFILADAVPSEGLFLMVGPGDAPPFDQSALDSMLRQTQLHPVHDY